MCQYWSRSFLAFMCMSLLSGTAFATVAWRTSPMTQMCVSNNTTQVGRTVSVPGGTSNFTVNATVTWDGASANCEIISVTFKQGTSGMRYALRLDASGYYTAATAKNTASVVSTSAGTPVLAVANQQETFTILRSGSTLSFYVGTVCVHTLELPETYVVQQFAALKQVTYGGANTRNNVTPITGTMGAFVIDTEANVPAGPSGPQRWGGGSGSWTNENWSVASGGLGAFVEESDALVSTTESITLTVPTDVSVGNFAVTAPAGVTVTLNGAGIFSPTNITITGGGTLALSGTSTSLGAKYVRFIPLSRPTSGNHPDGVALNEVELYQEGVKLPWTGCTVTASGFSSPHTPTRLTDGNISGNDTKWFLGGNPDLTEGAVWVQFAFTSPIAFDSYRLATADQNGRNPMSWRIDVSADGTNWTTVDQKSFPEATVTGWSTFSWLDTFAMDSSVVSMIATAPVTLGEGSQIKVLSGAFVLGAVTGPASATVTLDITHMTPSAGQEIISFTSAPGPQVKSTGGNASLLMAVRDADGLGLHWDAFDEAKAVQIYRTNCSARWEQFSPYNVLSPERRYTGCTATMLAQMLKAWQWPRRTQSETWTDDMSPVLGTIYFDGHVPFDWDLLDRTPSSTSDYQYYSLARPSFACGAIAHMNYGDDASASNLYRPSIVQHGYGPLQELVRDDQYSLTRDAWRVSPAYLIEQYRQSIVRGEPVLVNVPRHAVLCEAWAEDAIGRSYAGLNYGWGEANLRWYSTDRNYNQVNTTSSTSGIMLRIYTNTKPVPATDIASVPRVVGSSVPVQWWIPPCYTSLVTRTDIVATPFSTTLTNVTETFKTDALQQGFIFGDSRYPVENVAGGGTRGLRFDPIGVGFYQLTHRVRCTNVSKLSVRFRGMSCSIKDSGLPQGPRFYVKVSQDGIDWRDLQMTPYTNEVTTTWIQSDLSLSDYADQTLFVRLYCANPTGIANRYGADNTRGVFVDNLTLSNVLTLDPSQAITKQSTQVQGTETITGLTAGKTYEIAVTPQAPGLTFRPNSISTRAAGTGIDFPAGEGTAQTTSLTIDFTQCANGATSGPNWSCTSSNWIVMNWDRYALIATGMYGQSAYYGSLNVDLSGYKLTSSSTVQVKYYIGGSYQTTGEYWKISMAGTAFPNVALVYGSDQTGSSRCPRALVGQTGVINLDPISNPEQDATYAYLHVMQVTITNLETVSLNQVEQTLATNAPARITSMSPIEEGIRTGITRTNPGTSSVTLRIEDEDPASVGLTVKSSRPDILPDTAFTTENHGDGRITLSISQTNANLYINESYILTLTLTDAAGNMTYRNLHATYDPVSNPDPEPGATPGFRFELK